MSRHLGTLKSKNNIMTNKDRRKIFYCKYVLFSEINIDL